MDVDPIKTEKLQTGVLPIWEPGLDALVERNVMQGRLHFTTDAAHAVQHGQVQIIAVGRVLAFQRVLGKSVPHAAPSSQRAPSTRAMR